MAACTSLEDFQAMSADERADEVCTNTRGYRERSRNLRELDNAIADKEALLERGYRLHRQCRQVIVPAVHRDCGDVSPAKREACQQANAMARDTLANECIDIPVAIDAGFESQQLSEYRGSREMLQLDQDEALANCLDRVRAMDAAEAWRLHQNNRD